MVISHSYVSLPEGSSGTSSTSKQILDFAHWKPRRESIWASAVAGVAWLAAVHLEFHPRNEGLEFSTHPSRGTVKKRAPNEKFRVLLCIFMCFSSKKHRTKVDPSRWFQMDIGEYSGRNENYITVMNQQETGMDQPWVCKTKWWLMQRISRPSLVRKRCQILTSTLFVQMPIYGHRTKWVCLKRMYSPV